MENKLAKNKTINILTSIILSILMLGLGHISCGKIKRGIVLYFLSIFLFIFAAFICIQNYPPYNIILAALIFVAVYLFIIVDAIVIARNPDNTLKLKPIIGYSILVGVLILNSNVTSAFANIIRDDFIQAYKIPSGGMLPTLLIGDHILIDKHVYENNKPQRGDIIVFKYPKEPERMFIKRIVGIGGDIIEIKNKQLYINNALVDESYIIHTDSKIETSVRDNFGPFVVPQNKIFVMGDNRDQTFDSRFLGVVDVKDIQGKTINIYFSWDKEANSPRWNRLGIKIQ